MSKRAENFSIYMKRQGEFQFKFSGPTYRTLESGTEVVDRKGAIFIDAARTQEDGERCDWQNKIVMALGPNDFGQILLGLRSSGQSFDLTHQHDGRTTRLKCEPGQRAGSFKFSISQTGTDGTDKFVSVYAQAHQIMSFVQLVEFSIPRALGWHLV